LSREEEKKSFPPHFFAFHASLWFLSRLSRFVLLYMSTSVTRYSIRHQVKPSQKFIGSSPSIVASAKRVPRSVKRRRSEPVATSASVLNDPTPVSTPVAATTAETVSIASVGQLIVQQLKSQLSDFCKVEVKKAINKKKREFNSPSNEIQYGFNDSVLSSLKNFRKRQSVEADLHLLDKAIQDLEDRQEDILTADTCTNGWAVVNELHRDHDVVEDAGKARRIREIDELLSQRRRAARRSSGGRSDGGRVCESSRRGGSSSEHRSGSQRTERSERGGGYNGKEVVARNQCRLCYKRGHWAWECKSGQQQFSGRRPSSLDGTR